ncbi:hypothetical protein ACWF82_00800 [Nocardia sp. NPDC055053]
MTTNKIRTTIAVAAIAPMIALGAGISTAAPAEPPAPVQVAETSEIIPLPVVPAGVAAPFTLGLSLLFLPFCGFVALFNVTAGIACAITL